MKTSAVVALMALMSESKAQVLFPMPQSWNDNLNEVAKPLLDKMEPHKQAAFEHERGVPLLHQALDCAIHVEDKQCLHSVMANSPMVGAGHHVRAQTDVPIIGVLTQPVPDGNDAWSSEFERVQKAEGKEQPYKTFIESSHVKFLQSSGARVVPVPFDASSDRIETILKDLNGLYIPGDFKELVGHGAYQYTETVRSILQWAQNHHDKESKHFPIMGVGYGFLSLVKSQMRDAQKLMDTEAKGGLQINLLQDPKNTYVYDEYERHELEKTFDKIGYFSNLELGLDVSQFVIHEKDVGNIFVPVGTFDDASKDSQNEEMVAVIEGVIYPWFGMAYRLDRIQYSMEPGQRDLVDHSKDAIALAQKLGNLFIDEARLSSNRYNYLIHEVEALTMIDDQNPSMVEIPLIQSFPDHKMRTELYLY